MSDSTAGTGTQTQAASADTDPAAVAAAEIAVMPFDKALADLQGVVGRLESGGLPLEESITLYERGVALHDHCAKLLGGAELRVQRLVESAGGRLSTLDLRPDDEEG
jgi:exodeoxyribonuclease VII small subunit